MVMLFSGETNASTFSVLFLLATYRKVFFLLILLYFSSRYYSIFLQSTLIWLSSTLIALKINFPIGWNGEYPWNKLVVKMNHVKSSYPTHYLHIYLSLFHWYLFAVRVPNRLKPKEDFLSKQKSISCNLALSPKFKFTLKISWNYKVNWKNNGNSLFIKS